MSFPKYKNSMIISLTHIVVSFSLSILIVILFFHTYSRCKKYNEFMRERFLSKIWVRGGPQNLSCAHLKSSNQTLMEDKREKRRGVWILYNFIAYIIKFKGGLHGIAFSNLCGTVRRKAGWYQIRLHARP